MKYNRKLYPIIILIAMTVIFLNVINVSAQKTLFGGGGEPGTEYFYNTGGFLFRKASKFTCEIDSQYENYVKVTNTDNGCSIETLDIFNSVDVVLKVSKTTGDNIEVTNYEYNLRPNAMKRTISVGTIAELYSDFRDLNTGRITCSELTISDSSVTSLEHCEATSVAVKGLKPGVSTIVHTFNSTRFRIDVEVVKGAYTPLNNNTNNNDNNGQIPNENNTGSTTTEDDEIQDEVCTGLLGETLKKDLEGILRIIQIVAPLAVVLLTTTELLGAVISKDDDALTKGLSRMTTRIALVAVLFFLPIILNYLLKIVDSKYSTCIK